MLRQGAWGWPERFVTHTNPSPRWNASTPGAEIEPGERAVAERGLSRRGCAGPPGRATASTAGRAASASTVSAAQSVGLRQPGLRRCACYGAEAEGRLRAAPGQRHAASVPAGVDAAASGSASGPAAARAGCPRPRAGRARRPGRCRASPGAPRVSSAAARARRVPSSRSVEVPKRLLRNANERSSRP